jgi:hypothetical protein
MFCGGLGFQDRVSLCSPGCPGTPSVDQAGLELRNSSAFASQALGLKVCTTTLDQKKKKKFIYVYLARMFICVSCMLHSTLRSAKDIGPPGAWVIDRYKLPCSTPVQQGAKHTLSC